MEMSKRGSLTTLPWVGVVAIPLAVVLGLLLVVALQALPFDAVDWYAYQRIADVWHPYEAEIVFNPPWTYWLLWPLLHLPMQIGVVRLLALLVIVGVVLKSGGKRGDVLLVASSMPVLYLVANGNIDWLLGVAFLLDDKSWALPFLLIKPQVGALAGLAWVRERGWRVLVPTAILLVLSLWLYPGWPMQALANMRHMEGGLTRASWNGSIFPWGVPLGLWLAWRAWQKKDELAGVAASLLLSPYYGYYSLSLLLALAMGRMRTPALRALVVGVWLALWWVYFVLWRVAG